VNDTMVPDQTNPAPLVEILPVANHDCCDACGKLAVQAHVSILITFGEDIHDVKLCWHHARVRGYELPDEYRVELREDNRNQGSDHA
jgi:hypothetical protein